MTQVFQRHRHLLPLTPFLFFLSLALLLHFLHATLVYAGALTSADVQPASLLAGATSTVTISFTTSASGSIPVDGKIQVIFPSTFDISGASGGTCSTMNGGFSTSVSSSTLTITRDGTGTATANAHAESCTVNNIKNPATAQTSSTYSMATRNAANSILDNNNAVTADTFTANVLSSTNVQPASLLAGATSTVTVTFTTSNIIGITDKIVVVFPSGYNVSGASGATCSSMDGSFATSVSSQTVRIIRSAGSIYSAGVAHTCTIGNVVNPTSVTTTGTYTIGTTTSGDVTRDTDAAVAGDTTTPNVLSSTNVEPGSLLAGATSTVTATFTTSNNITATDKIQIIFPANYNVASASSGTCTGMDGSFATAVSGQTVTLTRSGGSTQTAGAKTCTVAGIINPTSAGSTGTYTLQTTTSSTAIRDQDTAVTADTITANSLSSTGLQSSSLVAGVSITATATFTTTNSLLATDKIKLTFPAGYNVSSAASGACTVSSVSIGSITTSVSGQVVILTRTSGSTVNGASALSCAVSGIINPSSSGSTGTYTFQTTASDDSVRDQNTAVSASTITGANLTGNSVVPGSLAAGATSTVTASFTIASDLLATDKVKITFPTGYNVSSAASGACTVSNVSIGSITTGVSGQVVTLTRTSGSTVTSGSAVSCTAGGIINPSFAGTTGTYTIQTTASDDSVRDQDAAVAGTVITANTLTSTDVQPGSLFAGATSTVTVNFTTANSLANTDKIKVTFPSGFDVSGVTSSASACNSSIDGNTSTTVSGQVVTITRTSGSLSSVGAKSCTVPNVVNNTAAGSTGTYSIQTTTSDDSVRDQDLAVVADTITANALSSITVTPSSFVAGATSTVTFNFTTANSLANTDKIKVTFPSGFDVSSVVSSSAVCTSIDGNTSTTVSGQIVTITRTSGTTSSAGAKSCAISNVKNPVVSGSSGGFSLQTTTSADLVRDQNLAIEAITITPATLGSAAVEPFSAAAFSLTNVRVSFANVNNLLSTDKIKVTFPSGFNLQNITSTSVNCSPSIDGGVTASVSGQILTISRTGTGSTHIAGIKTCIIANVGNPMVSGTTATPAIQTTSASGAVRDQDLAVSPIIIVSATGIAPGSTVPGSVGGAPMTSGGINLQTDSSMLGAAPSGPSFSTVSSDVQEVFTTAVNVTPTGVTTRPELLQNPTVANASLLIPKDTKIMSKSDGIYTGKISPPINVQQASLPKALPRNLAYRYAYTFITNQELTFDKAVTLTFPFAPVGVTENVKLYVYNSNSGEYQMVNSGGTIARDSKSVTLTTNFLGTFVAAATVSVPAPSQATSTAPAPSFAAPTTSPTPTTSSTVPVTTPVVAPLSPAIPAPTAISGVVVPPAPSAVPVSLVPLLSSPSISSSTTTDTTAQMSTAIPPFKDIADSHAADAIVQLYQLGVIKGTTPTTFEPDAPLTRGAAAKIAVLTYGYPVVESAVPKCSDVPASSSFAKYVAAAEKAGIMKGYADGTCRLDKLVTVAEGLKILAIASRKLPAAKVLATFPDAPFRDVADWASDYVNFAYANHLITGRTSVRLGSTDALTREDMADLAIQLRDL